MQALVRGTSRTAAALIAATCLLFATLAAAEDLPQIGGVLNIVAAETTVFINGVPVTTFAVEKDGSGGRGVDFTDWLMNGDNDVRLTVKPVTERAKATLEIQNFKTGAALLTLNQEGGGEQTGTIAAKGLPEWGFLRATAQSAEAEGLAAAVAELHGAYSKADIDRIVEVSAPFFADEKLRGGMDDEMFRMRAAPLFKSGTLGDLPELTINRHLDGKVFHVVGPDGLPPVVITFEEDGMKGAMRTGQWWSMIDGAWRVVR